MSLAELRKQKNLTLDEVAEQLGCSKQAYWNYEKGIRKIPLEKAVRLSKIYKVKVEEIFFYSTSNQNVNNELSV